MFLPAMISVNLGRDNILAGLVCAIAIFDVKALGHLSHNGLQSRLNTMTLVAY